MSGHTTHIAHRVAPAPIAMSDEWPYDAHRSCQNLTVGSDAGKERNEYLAMSKRSCC